MSENISCSQMKDRVRGRLEYLQMHENDATIPLVAIDVAIFKVETELKEIIDGWKNQMKHPVNS